MDQPGNAFKVSFQGLNLEIDGYQFFGILLGSPVVIWILSSKEIDWLYSNHCSHSDWTYFRNQVETFEIQFWLRIFGTEMITIRIFSVFFLFLHFKNWSEKVIKFSFIDPWELKDTKGPFQKKLKWSEVVSDSLWPHELYVAYQTPRSMEFSRQEYWSGLPFPSPKKVTQT